MKTELVPRYMDLVDLPYGFGAHKHGIVIAENADGTLKLSFSGTNTTINVRPEDLAVTDRTLTDEHYDYCKKRDAQ